ncbi:MAG TPA: STAS domain-containing protein [Rhodocyclaceae bacterium]|nr:STAS domain-containing protein [Rhodocyclaceae bacterium]
MAESIALLHVTLRGECTISTASAVRNELMNAIEVADQVEVDLAPVTEMDTAGIQLMVAAKSEAVARHKTLRFTGHSQAVIDSLDLTDLSAYFGDPVFIQSSN